MRYSRAFERLGGGLAALSLVGALGGAVAREKVAPRTCFEILPSPSTIPGESESARIFRTMGEKILHQMSITCGKTHLYPDQVRSFSVAENENMPQHLTYKCSATAGNFPPTKLQTFMGDEVGISLRIEEPQHTLDGRLRLSPADITGYHVLTVNTDGGAEDITVMRNYPYDPPFSNIKSNEWIVGTNLQLTETLNMPPDYARHIAQRVAAVATQACS